MQTQIENIDWKIVKAGLIRAKKGQVKTLSIGIKETDGTSTENKLLLEECWTHWNNLSDFRDRRMKSRKYYRGDQWHEVVQDPDSGDSMTEENYIISLGKLPLKQNLMRSTGRNILGQYRANPTKTVIVARDKAEARIMEMLTNALQACQELNDVIELDARSLEEFMLSGAAFGRIGYKYWSERRREDVYYEITTPTRMFFNTDLEDPRLKDLRLIGRMIDTTIDELVGAFAKTEADEEVLRREYSGAAGNIHTSEYSEGLTTERIDDLDFYFSDDLNKCRIYEIWQLKSEWRTYAHDYLDGSYQITNLSEGQIEQINAQRIEQGMAQGFQVDEIPLIETENRFDKFWYVKYLTPTARCLYEGETPYDHGEHPFVILLHPMLDGEVWGMMEDIIDQQRYINRLITLIDFIIGASAKGVLLVPENSIPTDKTIDDFAVEWTKYNGVIKYRVDQNSPDAIPKQIATNSTNVGAYELLTMQMRLIQEVSGVTGAIQGHAAPSGTPASLYAQEAQNATLNIKDTMDSFAWYKKKRDLKMLQVMRQYYNEPRYVAIAGRQYGSENAIRYEPDQVKNIEFDVTMAQSVDTPVYRQIIDDILMKLLDNRHIDITTFLKNSSLPFADSILQSLQSNQGQVSPEMLAQAQSGLDPKAKNVIDQLFSMPQK